MTRTATLRAAIAIPIVVLLFGCPMTAFGQSRDPGRPVQIVSPGQSIQTAIDHAAPGGWIFVLPGIYHETADATNGLSISQGIHLAGLSTAKKRVVLENSGEQRNGIVVVPQDRAGCMSCHSSLAPPFALLPGVKSSPTMEEPKIRGFSISGFTVRGFVNNGLFTENVDGFSIDDVHSVDNKNYGIFPTLSKNGSISHSRATGSGDTGVWVETSDNVLVTDTLVEGNLIGFEISNSNDVTLANSESRNNSIGLGVFLLPGIFASHPGSQRITVRDNSIHDNNQVNDAPPGTLPAALPSGTGVLLFGVDHSLITGNRIARNNLTGIAVVDVCVGFQGSEFDCSINPNVTPEFLADQEASNNRIVRNVLVHNGANPPPSPFAFAAGDLALLSSGAGNCFAKNDFTLSFSLLGFLPSCR